MSNRRIILGLTLLYAAFASAWVLSSDLFVEWLGGVDLLAMVSIPKGLLFVALTSAAFYLVMNAAAAGRLTRRATPGWMGVASAILLFGLSAGAAVLAGALVMWRASEPLLSHQVDELRTIAGFQIQALEQNRLKGEANARLLGGRRQFYEAIALWRASSDPAERDSLRTLMQDISGVYGFSRVEVLDGNGAPLLRVSGTWGAQMDVALVNEARRGGQMVFVPLHQDGSSSSYSYGFVVPLPAVPAGNAPASDPIFLLAEVNAADFVYPFLAHWPVPTRTGQSYMVRLQADGSYLLVSPMRVGNVAPFTRTFAPGTFDFALAANAPGAVARGGVSEGTTVLAVARHVGGTSVMLVAEISEAEATEAAQDVAIMSGLVLMLAIAGALAAAAALRQRDKLVTARRELHQAEALRQAEMRFRATFEQAAVGIVHLRLDGAFLRVNRKACEMMGYDREEFLAMNYRQLRHTNSARNDDAVIARLVSGQMEQVVDERCYIRKDGRPVWLSTSTTVARAADGTAEYLIVVAIDVSARHAAEERLRISDERFNLALLGATEGVWDIDLEAETLTVSPSWNRMLGLEEAPIVHPAATLSAGLQDVDAKRLAAALADARAGRLRTFSQEFQVRRRDGLVIDTLLRGHVVLDDGGHARRVVGTQTNITELKANERRLQQAAIVFSTAQEALVVTEADGTICAVNPSFSVITGYEEAEVVGRNMSLLNSGRHDRAFYAQMWATMLSTGHWHGEIWNRRKSGQVYPELLSIRAISDGSGGVTGYVASFTDLSSIKQSQSRLDHIAHHDALTDLPNRLLFLTLLDHAVTQARDRTKCAVLFLDLDRFKAVNDSLGHEAGDMVLVEVARRLRAALGDRDTLARYGGDEFMVLVEDVIGPQQAALAATRLIACLSQPLALPGAPEIFLGASVGIAMYPGDGILPQQLVQRADAALARAKAGGRGIYVFYRDGMTEAANARLELEARLRRAIERNELSLAYQPVVDLRDGAILGAEALLRWTTPDGPVAPSDFIPLAEETGLILSIGDWALEQACRQGADWLARGVPCGRIAVNLSARQFYVPDLPGHVATILRRTGFSPERLELEITESILLEDRVDTKQILRRLKEMKLRVALDDFGTGFSSLSYIRRFPVAKLKIDQSFVRDLLTSPADAQITIAIIALATALGVEVLAEGVEKQEQADFLRSNNCHQAQGYLFSAPVSADQFEDMVIDQSGRWRASAQ